MMQILTRRRRLVIGLVGWLLLVFAVAAIGAISSAGAGTFYQQLIRPVWAPPGWLFGPVWSALYFLMALSAWLVWRTHGFANAKVALALFCVQLAANALWTPLFFLWKEGGLAFVDILLLEALIIATIVAFWRLSSRAAAMLLLPYLAWVTFAACLNYSVWQLNPDILG